MSRHVIDGMRARLFGRIINISSINGQKGQMGQMNYSAAKAGMIGFTKALAHEGAAKGITVNTRLPPATSTPRWLRRCRRKCSRRKSSPQIPVGRLGTVEEIARAVTVPRRRRRRLHHRRLLRHQRRPLHRCLAAPIVMSETCLRHASPIGRDVKSAAQES